MTAFDFRNLGFSLNVWYRVGPPIIQDQVSFGIHENTRAMTARPVQARIFPRSSRQQVFHIVWDHIRQ